MKNIYLLLILSLFLFSSCSKNDDNGNGKVKLTASFFYIKGNEKKPDIATSLYIFKIDKSQQGNYEFKESQKYLEHKENKTVVYPFMTAQANNSGIVNIELDGNTFYQTVYISMIQPETWGIEYLDLKDKALFFTKEYALK